MVTDVAASSKSAAAVHREHHSNGLQSAGRVRPGRSQLITVRRSMDVPGITESTHAGGFARMGSGTLLDLTEAPSPARLPADPRPRPPAEARTPVGSGRHPPPAPSGTRRPPTR